METILNIYEFIGLCVGVLSVSVFYGALMPYAVFRIFKVVRATIKRL